MDYKAFLDNFTRVACVLSVDLKAADSKDRYFVVDANDAYKLTVVKKLEDFECNVPYTRYIQQADNFEALCDECVTKDRPVHTYFDIELYNAWMEVFFTPLASSDPDKKYILFSYEMNPKADLDKLTDISSETATNVIKTCLMLRETDDFQESMNKVIADIREQCGAKRCSILLADHEARKYSLLCEDYGNDPDQVPLSAFLNEDFYNVIDTWPRLIRKSNCFVMTNDKDMDEAHEIAPEWIDSLRGDNVRTIVIYPLRSDNKTIGYIWAGNFDPSKTHMIKETLSITSFILSAEIANEMNVRKMKIMSSTDLLTKATNDTKGHIAGDAMLKDVASMLTEYTTYEKAEIYRVGGDEFLIITPGMESGDFEEYVKTLRANCERPGRSHFAVGACHSKDAEGSDIRKAMQKADAEMYDIKEEYYSRHPEMNWHNKIV